MKTLLAKAFRQLFKIKFFKRKFYGVHQRIFKPFKLFNKVVCTINYNGFKLNLKIDDWIQENIFFLGEYEKAELIALEHHLKPGDTFLDLGANLGLYSLHASRFVGEKGKVISFEPFSVNYNALKEHIAINQLTNVCLEKLAVGKETGTITMYLDEKEGNLGMVTANYIENAREEVVDIVSIDEYLDLNPIKSVDFIKIDIEGFEYPTLLGLENTLKKHRPTLLIEILEDEASAQNDEKVHVFLNGLGYTKNFISDNGALSNSPTNLLRKNYLFTATHAK
jgi:FkbM family methyltransferase